LFLNRLRINNNDREDHAMFECAKEQPLALAQVIEDDAKGDRWLHTGRQRKENGQGRVSTDGVFSARWVFGAAQTADHLVQMGFRFAKLSQVNAA